MSDRIPSICADQYVNPPNWAIQQRRLIDLMILSSNYMSILLKPHK